MQNTTGRTERRWLNCLGAATWPEVVRRYCLFHMAKYQDAQITNAAGESLTQEWDAPTELIRSPASELFAR